MGSLKLRKLKSHTFFVLYYKRKQLNKAVSALCCTVVHMQLKFTTRERKSCSTILYLTHSLCQLISSVFWSLEIRRSQVARYIVLMSLKLSRCLFTCFWISFSLHPLCKLRFLMHYLHSYSGSYSETFNYIIYFHSVKSATCWPWNVSSLMPSAICQLPLVEMAASFIKCLLLTHSSHGKFLDYNKSSGP